MAGGIDWFRWHHGSVTDPKFGLVAKKAGARLGDVIAVWAFILESASANERRGTVDQIDFEALEYLLGLDEGQAFRILDAMTQRGLLGAGGVVVSWEKRQPKREREDDSSERVKKYRDRVKANGGEVGDYLRHHAYVMERDGWACVYCGTKENLCLDHMIPVIQGGSDDKENLAAACKACNSGKSGRTPEEAGYSIRSEGANHDYQKSMSRHVERSHAMSRHVTPRGEESREEEKREEKTRESASPAERARASRLPPDWQPDDSDSEFLTSQRPDLDLRETASRFRDYWHAQPGAKGRKLDWPATWRNWVRTEKARARVSPADRPAKFDPVAFVNKNRITQ